MGSRISDLLVSGRDERDGNILDGNAETIQKKATVKLKTLAISVAGERVRRRQRLEDKDVRHGGK